MIDPKNGILPNDFPIVIDEDARTVEVPSGTSQRVLLDFLANYTVGQQPLGWTLRAFPWFIDQTIGGAVATGTHGSSMSEGSLSSQVASIEVVIANGSVITVDREDDSHLFRALGVSVGRLGAITKVKMSIVPQVMVRKTDRSVSVVDFVNWLYNVQDAYKAAVDSGDQNAVRAALLEIDETQIFWNVAMGTIRRFDFDYDGKSVDSVSEYVYLGGGNGGGSSSSGEASPGYSPAAPAATEDLQSVYQQRFKEAVAVNQAMLSNAYVWGAFYADRFGTYEGNVTLPNREAYPSITAATTGEMNTFAPYIQTEVSVPLEQAGTCMGKIATAVYSNDELWQGFRNIGLIRFMPGEKFYLSPTNGGPRMYVNLEDYLTLSGANNSQYTTVIGLFRSECDARLHWGKAGWPEHASCFDGASEYSNGWCQFGCAANALDPTNKFRGNGQGVTDVWQWHATRDGQSVEFSSCCSDDGFSSECQCASRPACS